MLEWSTPGLISFSNSPDCIIVLFSEYFMPVPICMRYKTFILASQQGTKQTGMQASRQVGKQVSKQAGKATFQIGWWQGLLAKCRSERPFFHYGPLES